MAQRVFETVHPDLAAVAHRLGFFCGGTTLGEEQVGIDAETVGAFLPPTVFIIFIDTVSKEFAHRLVP